MATLANSHELTIGGSMSEEIRPRSADAIRDAQREALANPDAQRAFRARILEEHTRERGRTDPGADRPLAIGEIVDRDLPLFVAWDHILVRTEDAKKANKELGPDFECSPIGCLCGVSLPVVRFKTTQPMDLETLEKAVVKLHRKHINASFEHVYPDGGIKGGQGLADPVDAKLAPAHKAQNAKAGEGVIVAVIDTGIAEAAGARTDEWITDIAKETNKVGYDVLDEPGSPKGLDAGAGHGTFVAGVIRQVAPAADVRIYRALDSDGVGSEEGIACAIVRAWRDGATIINLSLGQESYRDHPPVALAAALELISDDVVVVAAAGNLGGIAPDDPAATRPHWPAAFRRVVGVGGLDPKGKPAKWSKRGAWVDCSTVGEDIVSTFVDGQAEVTKENPNPPTFVGTNPWATWLGTSFAAPQIAGLVAATTAPGKYWRRIPPRPALATVLARSYWYEYGFGALIKSPL